MNINIHSFKMNIPIPDCFVSPLLKLSNGKNGHGERRLYTGNNYYTNEYICKKPWYIKYPKNYKNDILDILNDETYFSKICKNRKNIVYDLINYCDEKLIYVCPQNGKTDVKRYYIGPNKDYSENIKLYDKFRCTIIPKLFHIKLIEKNNFYECNIINNENFCDRIHKKNSNVCIEWLSYVSKTLNIEIQHEYNKNEFKLRNPLNGYFWPVDGYHNCNIHRCQGNINNPCKYNNNIWEFYGDYYHGNPLKYNDNDLFHNITYLEKHYKDLNKIKYFQNNGYIVNIKWESEWTEEKKLMKKFNIKWY